MDYEETGLQIGVIIDKYDGTNIIDYSVSKEKLNDDSLENIELIKSKFGIERSVIVKGEKRSIQYCGAILMNYLITNIAYLIVSSSLLA